MRAVPCPVPGDLAPLLPGYDYADAFAIPVRAGACDAPAAARATLERGPRWVGTLLGLRNLLMAPFGLRGAGAPGPEPHIGWFPVVSESADRVVLGFDDRHLDFRIVVDHHPGAQTDQVITTTLVRRHNLGGRLYLAAVLPFHRAIVPRMLAPLANSDI